MNRLSHFSKHRRGARAGNVMLRIVLAMGIGLIATFFFFRQTPKVADAQAPASSAATQSRSSIVEAPSSAAAEFVAPLEEPKRLELRSDKLVLKASSRGARLVSARLLGFKLHADSDPHEAADPERCLELMYHSGAPVSALSIFAPGATYSDPSHPLHPIVTRLETADWNLEEIAPSEGYGAGVRWTLDAAHLRFIKTFRLLKADYRGEWSLRIEALDKTLEESQDALSQLQLLLLPGAWLFSDHDQFFASPSAVAGVGEKGATPKVFECAPPAFQNLDTSAVPVFKDVTEKREGIRFVADANKYFIAGIVPKDAETLEAIAAVRALGIAKLTPVGKETRVASAALLVAKLPKLGEPRTWSFDTYFGPKKDQLLTGVDVLSNIVEHSRSDWAIIRWVSALLLWLMRFYESITGNWGVAIILLTVTVRALLIPLNRRMQVSTADFARKQAAIKPQLEVLEKKFAGNSRKLNEERLKLMKDTGTPVAPPIMGCLPTMLIQIPAFFGLFAAVRTTYDLRHQPFFGWIHDLSSPDAFLTFAHSYSIPLLGDVRGLNLLPILMVVLWLVHQQLMPKPTDPQQAQMQKFMMFMPVFFGLMLYNYAAGLSVYMITSSLTGIVEQTVLKKLWPIPGAAGAPMAAMATP